MRLIDAEPLEELLHSRAAQCSNEYGSLAGAIAGCLKLVRVQPTITPSPNPPLTLEDLRKMDGEPVYLSPGDCWVLTSHNGFVPIFTWPDGSNCSACDWYTQVGLAYRRKPEEANHG